ncbi:MAG: hypothetical protein V3V75_08840, partial [Thermoguttaceae bacterium]
MKFKEHSSWLFVLGILLIGLPIARADGPAEPVAPVEEATTGETEAIDLFQAIDDGLVDVKFVARSDTKGRLVLTNKTSE